MVYSDICISLHFCTSITEEKGLGGGSGYSFTHLYTNKDYLVRDNSLVFRFLL